MEKYNHRPDSESSPLRNAETIQICICLGELRHFTWSREMVDAFLILDLT